MNDKDTKKLIDMSFQLTFILGYATELIINYRDCIYTDDEEIKKCDWVIEAIENIIYLDKPLPEMP